MTRLFRRNCFWMGLACVSLFFIVGCAGSDESGAENKKNNFFDAARQDIVTLPEQVIDGSRDTFLRKDNIAALLLAGGATIAMNQGADNDIADYFDRHEVFHNVADRSLNLFGGPGFHFAATGLWYALSVENGDDFNRQRAATMITALSVTGLTTVGLKAIRNDETPVGNDWAWPSGHTSSSFTVASVLDEFYGPGVGIPAYVVASLVGLMMMD